MALGICTKLKNIIFRTGNLQCLRAFIGIKNGIHKNPNYLPPKPKFTFRHLKLGIQDFHRKYVLVPADKAANNVVVV